MNNLLRQYSEFTESVDLYLELDPFKTGCLHDVICGSLGLAAETGEVCGKLVKIILDHEGRLSTMAKREIAYELGDVLWHIDKLCRAIGISLEEVLVFNTAKLSDQAKRNKLQGSGDKR